MSSSRQIIPAIFDQQVSARRVIVGDQLKAPDSTQVMMLYYGTQVLFCATIYSGAPTVAYNPVQPCSWLFGLDDVPFSDVPDYVLSQDDQFNIPGDWTDLNEASGKISWRANLATAELKTGLNKKSGATTIMFCNLWMLSAAGNVLIGSWPITVGKVYVDPTIATPVEGITHLTTEAAVASYVPIWGDGAYERRKNGRTQYLFPDGKWRAKIATIVEGQPTETWGDPED